MNRLSLLGRLAEVGDFIALQKKTAGIRGWLTDLEGYVLYMMAAEGPGTGEIVEIGSFMGRSTAFLASGAKQAGREKVTAIDHFTGSPEHQVGQSLEIKEIAQGGSTFDVFSANMKKMAVEDYVSPIVASSEEAARDWHKPIRLLFIDADHSYEESRKDFELWSGHVAPRGLICFHDIGHWEGVTRFYNELMARKTHTELVAARSVRVIQKSS